MTGYGKHAGIKLEVIFAVAANTNINDSLQRTLSYG